MGRKNGPDTSSGDRGRRRGLRHFEKASFGPTLSGENRACGNTALAYVKRGSNHGQSGATALVACRQSLGGRQARLPAGRRPSPPPSTDAPRPGSRTPAPRRLRRSASAGRSASHQLAGQGPVARRADCCRALRPVPAPPVPGSRRCLPHPASGGRSPGNYGNRGRGCGRTPRSSGTCHPAQHGSSRMLAPQANAEAAGPGVVVGGVAAFAPRDAVNGVLDQARSNPSCDPGVSRHAITNCACRGSLRESIRSGM